MGETSGRRYDAIDALRGLVMVIMATDHASHELNRGGVITDSAMFYTPGTPLPFGQFLTRWCSHLCAPTFVTLAGTALAISTTRRAARGEDPRAIDRHILLRGSLLVVFEVAWMSWVMRGPGLFLFQVLYALGMSLMCMALLRRLSARMLVGAGAALVFGVEPLVTLLGKVGLRSSFVAAATVSGGFFGTTPNGPPRLVVAYPFVPWLALMCIGWGLGRWLVDERPGSGQVARSLAVFGGLSLSIFALLRWANGYGNFGLYRDDGSLVQWLHVSKYPPSVTFVGLEVGIGALALAFFFATAEKSIARLFTPLRILGSTALFFYLLHIHLLHLAAWATGTERRFGMAGAWVGGLAVVVVLYPACVFYRRYKLANPGGLAQWI